VSAATNEELLTAKEGACACCEPEAVAKVKKALAEDGIAPVGAYNAPRMPRA
jgi:hypothetical protein